MNVVKVRYDSLLEMLNIRFQALSPQIVKIRPVGEGFTEILNHTINRERSYVFVDFL